MFGSTSQLALQLLASNPLFESLSRAVTDQPSGDDVLFFWTGVGGFIVIVLIIARAAHRRSTPRTKPKVDYLTAAIDLLGLSESERRELQRIARRARLDEPASMLLTPRNLSRAAGETLAGQAAIEARQRVATLGQKLFGEAIPTTVPPIPALHPEGDEPKTAPERSAARARRPRADAAARAQG